MLPQVEQKISSYYAGQRQLGTDGALHDMDLDTRVDRDQGIMLAELHKSVRPKLSVEVGLAYGYSTLFFLDVMHREKYGHHIAIDPFQVQIYDGIGATAIREVGLETDFKWIEGRSSHALCTMATEGARAQFIYIDGDHKFDATLIDFMLSDQILDVGGVIAIDDMWMSSIKTVAAFIDANLTNYAREKSHHNIVVYRKTSVDSRRWDHFVPFSLDAPKPKWRMFG